MDVRKYVVFGYPSGSCRKRSLARVAEGSVLLDMSRSGRITINQAASRQASDWSVFQDHLQLLK